MTATTSASRKSSRPRISLSLLERVRDASMMASDESSGRPRCANSLLVSFSPKPGKGGPFDFPDSGGRALEHRGNGCSGACLRLGRGAALPCGHLHTWSSALGFAPTVALGLFSLLHCQLPFL